VFAIIFILLGATLVVNGKYFFRLLIGLMGFIIGFDLAMFVCSKIGMPTYMMDEGAGSIFLTILAFALSIMAGVLVAGIFMNNLVVGVVAF